VKGERKQSQRRADEELKDKENRGGGECERTAKGAVKRERQESEKVERKQCERSGDGEPKY
jgi:hypothetical protein